MTPRIQHWDAFTRQTGKGNPAGIVLAAENLSDSDMQAIARKIAFNDTAFVMPSRNADVRIRYFAPQREVSLCGHATVAAFSALHKQDLSQGERKDSIFSLETKSGVLTIGLKQSEDGYPVIIMNQGVARFEAFGGSREKLAAALGIAEEEIHPTLPITYGSTGRWTLVVPISNLATMQQMRPSQGEFAGLLKQFPGASIHPFCRETIGGDASMHARHFSSASSGTLEDAVTGTASGVLGAYYNRFIADRTDPNQPLIVEQGYEIAREGSVQVWAIRQDDDYLVRIAGIACFVGDIDV